MKNMTTLRHIAGLYLEVYSQNRNLERPLSPEQVKDASVAFLDLLCAYEAECLIEHEHRYAKTQHQAANLTTGIILDKLASTYIEVHAKAAGITPLELTQDDISRAIEKFQQHVRFEFGREDMPEA